MTDQQLLTNIQSDIKETVGKTEAELELASVNYIEENADMLNNIFIKYKNPKKEIIFIAGGSGAGKSKTAQNLAKKYSLDIIDTNSIRSICPKYSGANASIFQKAASKGVGMLFNICIKNSVCLSP
ncbi:zeta toxin family protein [Abyssogena phaseoliformis symbiont]|uniref:zeta toxin family protein n=1 Tax=Abyssogena phaseoliformis symbiont TaxID=596095 RepID=UPI001916417D|nr:zeta toxin family protein [Abyssogena phaseoliformis symbiont]